MPKASLRSQIQLKSRQIDVAHRAAASHSVCEALCAYVDAHLSELTTKGVAIFRSLPDEISLDEFEAALVQRNTPFQILTAKNQPNDHPALLIVPGVAFDGSGHRLGRGGGYYDKLLAQLRASQAPPVTVGVCYDHQLVAKVPTEPHDQRMGMLCTPLRGLFTVDTASSEK